MTAPKPRKPDIIEAEARKRAEREAQRQAKPQRPRIITATAVLNELAYGGGCMVCSMPNNHDGRTRHRGGCLFVQYERAAEAETQMRHQLELMLVTMHDIRRLANSPEAKGRTPSMRRLTG